nr:unnamed protein product [Naegleria fowleri]
MTSTRNGNNNHENSLPHFNLSLPLEPFQLKMNKPSPQPAKEFFYQRSSIHELFVDNNLTPSKPKEVPNTNNNNTSNTNNNNTSTTPSSIPIITLSISNPEPLPPTASTTGGASRRHSLVSCRSPSCASLGDPEDSDLALPTEPIKIVPYSPRLPSPIINKGLFGGDGVNFSPRPKQKRPKSSPRKKANNGSSPSKTQNFSQTLISPKNSFYQTKPSCYVYTLNNEQEDDREELQVMTPRKVVDIYSNLTRKWNSLKHDPSFDLSQKKKKNRITADKNATLQMRRELCDMNSTLDYCYFEMSSFTLPENIDPKKMNIDKAAFERSPMSEHEQELHMKRQREKFLRDTRSKTLANEYAHDMDFKTLSLICDLKKKSVEENAHHHVEDSLLSSPRKGQNLVQSPRIAPLSPIMTPKRTATPPTSNTSHQEPTCDKTSTTGCQTSTPKRPHTTNTPRNPRKYIVSAEKSSEMSSSHLNSPQSSPHRPLATTKSGKLPQQPLPPLHTLQSPRVSKPMFSSRSYFSCSSSSKKHE